MHENVRALKIKSFIVVKRRNIFTILASIHITSFMTNSVLKNFTNACSMMLNTVNNIESTIINRSINLKQQNYSESCLCIPFSF